jgi:tRNA uridine 5-carboxymethylaminomethyl modification enzyme
MEKQQLTFGEGLSREHSLLDLLRRPAVTYAALQEWMPEGLPAAGTPEAEQIEISAKYAGYVERQKEEVARQLAQESVELPADIDYASVRGLSKEVQQRLAQHRPQTVGQASRVQGVTPAAISLLLVHLKRRSIAAREHQA